MARALGSEKQRTDEGLAAEDADGQPRNAELEGDGIDDRLECAAAGARWTDDDEMCVAARVCELVALERARGDHVPGVARSCFEGRCGGDAVHVGDTGCPQVTRDRRRERAATHDPDAALGEPTRTGGEVVMELSEQPFRARGRDDRRRTREHVAVRQARDQRLDATIEM